MKPHAVSCLRAAIAFLLIVAIKAGIDDEISFGGGETPEPRIRLTKGDTYPVDIMEGELLDSECILEDVEIEDFKVTWVTIDRNGDSKILSENAYLSMADVRSENVRQPIYCRAERLEDGEYFDRQMQINLRVITQPKTIQVVPMPSDDPGAGLIVRRCEIVPSPSPGEIWNYVWSNPHGRVVSSNDILTVTLSGDSGLGSYTCEATNHRTSEILRAELKIEATRPSVTPYQESYNTQIEPLTEKLQFGQPFSARCSVVPKPAVSVRYTWYYKDAEFAQGDTLNLPDFNRQTMGNFVCEAISIGRASDGSTPTFSNATLTLRLKASSESHTEMKAPPGSTLITYVGETRELHCEVENANSDVRWFFNGSELHTYAIANRTGNLKRVDFRRVSILTIDKVETYQEGSYECRTDNSVKTVNVVVLSDFEVEVNPPEYIIDEGEDVEIHCSVQGGTVIPNKDLRWFFRPAGTNRRILLDFSGQSGFIRTDDIRAYRTSVIVKLRAMRSDEGEYICQEPRGQEGISHLVVRKSYGGGLRITPKMMRIRPGQDAQIQCYSFDSNDRAAGPTPKLRVFDDRLNIQTRPFGEYGVKGTISGLDSTKNGTIIECYSDNPSITPVRTVIYVEDICPPGYRRCRNGQCLEAGRFCDGRYDCTDQSDEDKAFCAICDPIAKRCESYGGRSPSKNTYMVHWRCDGEDDCGNGFDEASCNDHASSSCTGTHYTCPRSGQRIPRAFVCDKDADCDEREDEQFCTEPEVLDRPRELYNARRGDRVELTCEVAGTPSPYVIWRFNWNCLPEEGSRMIIHNTVRDCNTPNQRVVSTLTINNFGPGDDGIYNCEGLNLMKRSMSQDYFVVLRD